MQRITPAMCNHRLPRVDLPSRTYYLTCCTDRRHRLLCADPAAQMIIDLYAGYRDRGDIRLHGYVVMPDHYHVIVTLTVETSVSNLVRKVHGLFSWRWYGRGAGVAGHEGPALPGGGRVAGHEGPSLPGGGCVAGHEGPALPRRGRVWERRFYDHVVRNEEDWRTRMAYLHDNPRRAGLVEAAVGYLWSSAAFWETGTGPVTCDGVTW